MFGLELAWCANNKVQLTAHVATALVVRCEAVSCFIQNNIEWKMLRIVRESNSSRNRKYLRWHGGENKQANKQTGRNVCGCWSIKFEFRGRGSMSCYITLLDFAPALLHVIMFAWTKFFHSLCHCTVHSDKQINKYRHHDQLQRVCSDITEWIISQ